MCTNSFLERFTYCSCLRDTGSDNELGKVEKVTVESSVMQVKVVSSFWYESSDDESSVKLEASEESSRDNEEMPGFESRCKLCLLDI